MTAAADEATREIRAEVARIARMLAAAGLVEGFGHVSARTPSGFAITSVAPMQAATGDGVIVMDSTAVPRDGPGHLAPLESPMHAAIYAVRPDVGGICRGHPPYTVAWGVGTENLPLLHGLGALAGHPVMVHDDIQLITDPVRGRAVAASLGDAASLILRSNGALAVGRDPLEAATRLFFLEERARVVRTALAVPDVGESNWETRLRQSDGELTRAKAWFSARFESGPGGASTGSAVASAFPAEADGVGSAPSSDRNQEGSV